MPAKMPEHDPLVFSFSHLKNFPRENEALHTLKKIASLVKPIMRARGWKVGELAEFYPDQANLLGLNVNRGQKILLRLRYAGDRNQFLPIEQVTDTMLHELSHIVHGPHDAKFHALWDQLRDEHEGLKMKGYTGEGFLGDGRRLGGRQVPLHEARRLARIAAEKRRTLGAGSGQRLGGAGPRPGQDIRKVIVDAVERRNNTLKGCGSTNYTEKEIQEISDTATRNGFRTKAEEDAANEAAIAQALWELVQEDEKQKYGDSYIHPSAENPAGNGGWSEISERDKLAAAAGARNGYSRAPPPPPVPVDTKPGPSTILAVAARSVPSPTPMPAPAELSYGWTCSVCTLHNPPDFLCCDACGTERGEHVSRKPADRPQQKPRPTANSSGNTARKAGGNSFGSSTPTQGGTPPAAFWQCSFCGTMMERQWWTCQTCGLMKDNSK